MDFPCSQFPYTGRQTKHFHIKSGPKRVNNFTRGRYVTYTLYMYNGGLQTHTHTHTLSLSLSLFHSLTHTRAHTHTHEHTHTHTQVHKCSITLEAMEVSDLTSNHVHMLGEETLMVQEDKLIPQLHTLILYLYMHLYIHVYIHLYTLV